MTDTNPVYMIVMLDINDMPTFFEEYASPLQAIHARYGVEVLAATPEPAVLEGNYSKSFTVLLKFASAEKHAEWWADPDYQPLRERRHELTNTDTSVAMVVPTFAV